MTRNPAWFQHDCESGCIFVGNIKEGDPSLVRKKVDFWVHPRDGGWYDLIRRYSDTDHDYGCMTWRQGETLSASYRTLLRYARQAGVIPKGHPPWYTLEDAISEIETYLTGARVRIAENPERYKGEIDAFNFVLDKLKKVEFE